MQSVSDRESDNRIAIPNDDQRSLAAPLGRKSKQEFGSGKGSGGRADLQEVKIDPPGDQTGHMTLKKEVFQSLLIRRTKTARINLGHTKDMVQKGRSIEDAVSNLPAKINKPAIEGGNM